MKRIMSVFLAILLLIAPIAPVYAQDTGNEVIRIAGTNRYETAVNISAEVFEESHIAIIASGESFPDALVGGSLAAFINVPILVVQKNHVPQIVFDEIERLGVEYIYLLGGVNTISADVESALASKVDSVERIAGANRYETSWEVAYLREAFLADITGEEVIGGDITYVSGTSFPDALAAAPYVGQIVYNYDPGYGLERLILAKPGENVENMVVIGGENSVPGENAFQRISGPNRYATAVEIAKLYPYFVSSEINTVVLVDGTNFPDALASASLVSTQNAVLLLTTPNKLSPETKAYIEENNITQVIIVGGEKSVSKAVEDELAQLLNTP